MAYFDPFSPYSPFGHAPGAGHYPPAPGGEPDWLKIGSTMVSPFILPAMSATGVTAAITGVAPWLSNILGPGGGPAGPIGYGVGTLLPIAMDMIRPGSAKNEAAIDEFQSNLNRFKVDAAQRVLGAQQLSGLASLHDNDAIKTSTEWAALGLMGNPEQEADYLSHRHQWVPGHPELVQGFLDKAPELKEQNWQAYLRTMDASADRNIDMTPVGYTPATKPEEMEQKLTDSGVYSIWEAPKFDAPRHAFNVLDPNAAISAADAYFGITDPHAGGGQSLADEALGGTAGPGGYSAEELASMGFRPGHYGEAMKKYLMAQNPSISGDPRFGSIFDPTVAGPTGVDQAGIDANDAAFQGQVDAWKKNLTEQQNLWLQQWQRDVGERQQRWTGGGY